MSDILAERFDSPLRCQNAIFVANPPDPDAPRRTARRVGVERMARLSPAFGASRSCRTLGGRAATAVRAAVIPTGGEFSIRLHRGSGRTNCGEASGSRGRNRGVRSLSSKLQIGSRFFFQLFAELLDQ